MIDILAYELKYKNDPMVMELLRAYQKELPSTHHDSLFDEEEDYE